MKRRHIAVLLMMAMAVLLCRIPRVAAESTFFSANCTTSGCHATSPSTCNGCHAHGAHSSSAKNDINIAGTLNKTAYAPGETVSVSITGGYRTGWVRAILYDQNMNELARSTGTATGGKGGGPAFPTTLTATAPTAPGTYTWSVSWYGNRYDKAQSPFFQTTCSATVTTNCWKPAANPNHGEEIRSLATFTVAAPADTTAPVVTAFSIPAASSSLTVAITTLTATDASGVTGYLLTETPAAPLATAAGWTVTAPASYTFGSAGSKTLYAWAKDAAGNVSNSFNASVTITLLPAEDTTAPVVTAFSILAASGSLTVSVTTFAATDAVGVTGYLLTETPAAPLATAAGWSGTVPASYTFVSAGAKTLYAWAKDAAGNVSNSLSAGVILSPPDTTAPVVVGFSIPAASNSLTVPITTLTAADATGVTGYLLTETPAAPLATAAGWSGTVPASYTFVSAGAKTLYAWAKDAAGNVSNSLSAGVTITLAPAGDTTAPVVTAFSIPATANALTVSVTTLSATDANGVTGYLLTETSSMPPASAAGWTVTAPTIYTFGSAGAKTLYAWAKDAAGNVSSSLSASVTITVSTADTTPPMITVFDVPAIIYSLRVPITGLEATDDVGVTGYMVKKNPLKPSAADAGWRSSPPASVTIPDAGAKTLYAWAKDAAGNISDMAAMTVVAKLSMNPAPIPVPASQEMFAYSAVAFPAERQNLAKSKPLGIGALAEGGILDLQASIGPFSGPVDAYITMYAPEAAGGIEPLAVYYLRPDNSFVEFTAAAEPWQQGVTDINEHILEIPAGDLLPGPYILVLTVTPAGSQGHYYKWSTSFIVPHRLMGLFQGEVGIDNASPQEDPGVAIN